MTMRMIPWAIGAFMLVPLALWFAMWIWMFPGPKHGLEAPLSVAMGVISLPLVAWFYVSSLGMVANSIGDRDPFATPRTMGLNRLVAVLPLITLMLGVASVVGLWMVGEPLHMIAVPFIVSVFIAFGIRTGERARQADPLHAIQPPRESRVVGMLGKGLSAFAAIPVIGWPLRDAVRRNDADKALFGVNLLAGCALTIYVFGYPALIIIALSGVVLAFAFLAWIIAD